MDISQAFAFIDERFREAGSCRDGTYSISHTERNHRRDQDHSVSAASTCCRLQIPGKTSLLETLGIWPLSARVLHWNTPLEIDVKLGLSALPSVHTPPSSGEEVPSVITGPYSHHSDKEQIY